MYFDVIMNKNTGRVIYNDIPQAVKAQLGAYSERSDLVVIRGEDLRQMTPDEYLDTNSPTQ
jgi:hypothetical protein